MQQDTVTGMVACMVAPKVIGLFLLISIQVRKAIRPMSGIEFANLSCIQVDVAVWNVNSGGRGLAKRELANVSCFLFGNQMLCPVFCCVFGPAVDWPLWQYVLPPNHALVKLAAVSLSQSVTRCCVLCPAYLGIGWPLWQRVVPLRSKGAECAASFLLPSYFINCFPCHYVHLL